MDEKDAGAKEFVKCPECGEMPLTSCVGKNGRARKRVHAGRREEYERLQLRKALENTDEYVVCWCGAEFPAMEDLEAHFREHDERDE